MGQEMQIVVQRGMRVKCMKWYEPVANWASYPPAGHSSK
jgi:hypothetical protein